MIRRGEATERCRHRRHRFSPAPERASSDDGGGGPGLAARPERSDLPREHVQHVLDLARRDVALEELEDGPGDALGVDLGIIPEVGGDVVEEDLEVAPAIALQ
jgi:hypothetical protein